MTIQEDRERNTPRGPGLKPVTVGSLQSRFASGVPRIGT